MSKRNTMHAGGSTENLKCYKGHSSRIQRNTAWDVSTYVLHEPAASNRRVKQLQCARQAHHVSHKQWYTSKQTTWYRCQEDCYHNIHDIKYFDWLRQHNYMQPKTSTPADQHIFLCSLFMQKAKNNIHHSYPISLRVATGNVSISGSGSELSSSTVYMIVASGGTSGFRPCAPYPNRGPTSKRATSPTSISGSARSKPWITCQTVKL